jgi:hypothetical protein
VGNTTSLVDEPSPEWWRDMLSLQIRLRVRLLSGRSGARSTFDELPSLASASRKRMPSEQMQLSICSCRESLEPSARSAARRSPPATSASRASH